MTAPTGADPYQRFAAEYDWLYDAFSLRVGTRTPGVQAALQALPAGARVLDAACGTGIDALSLHRRGLQVVAADASGAMLERCRARLAEVGADVTVVEAPWDRLPDLVDGGFDAVLCTGNALGHAPDREARQEALRAFATVLADRGIVILDGQDWDAVRSEGDQVLTDPHVVTRDGIRCTRSFQWSLPTDPSEPHTLTVELVFVDAGTEHRSSHAVVLHPFTPEELHSDLTASGFTDPELVAVPGFDRWSVTARRQARGSSPRPTRSS